MQNTSRYVPKSTRKSNNPQGRPVNPNNWITGPCPVTRDKYYAWLKHKAQAKFRNEEYHLTWEDWQTLWSNEDFLKRGRQKHNLSMQKIDIYGAWELSNCIVATRHEYLKRAKEYRDYSK